VATGDSTDILARIKSNLPPWFPSSTPVVDAVFTGFSAAAAWIYSLIQNVYQQTRLKTMSGQSLDLFAYDFFGFNGLQRGTAETDQTYQARISKEIFRERATRHGISQALFDLTGQVPNLFEPWNPSDCGGYDIPQSCGYDVYGFLGDNTLKYTIFIQAWNPYGEGIPVASGYDDIGGYNAGWLEYGDQSLVQGPLTSTQLYQCVNANRAAGVTAWLQINQGPNPHPPAPVITMGFGGTLDFRYGVDSDLIAVIL
jgi:hypothetical protein